MALTRKRPVPFVLLQNTPLERPLAESPANSTAGIVTGALTPSRRVSAAPGIAAATRAGPHDVPDSAVTVRSLASAMSPGVRFASRTGTLGTGTAPSESTATVIRKRSEEHTSELQSRLHLV